MVTVSRAGILFINEIDVGFMLGIAVRRGGRE
jgi:hypothetical protein